MPTTTNTRFLIEGLPALLMTDICIVVGCPYIAVPVGKPQPCAVVRWITGSRQFFVYGIPVLLQDSIGICYAMGDIPQGQACAIDVQQKVTSQ